MIATLELVELRRGGGVLTAAVTAGATVLPVDLTLDYNEAGGLLELGGEVYTYTAVGDDFVTLASGVLADAEVDTPAWTVDAEGNREETWKAWVDLGDDGDTVPASIPTSLIGYFPEGDAATGQDVEVEATADGYRVANRPDQAALLDGAQVDVTTLPPVSDGNAPTSATTVTPIGGIGSMFYRWTEVANADPVTYRLYVRAGASPAAPTLLATNLSTDPSYELTESWAAVSGSTDPVRSTDRAWIGSYSVKFSRGAGTTLVLGRRSSFTSMLPGAGTYRVAVRMWVDPGITGNAGLRLSGTGVGATQSVYTAVRSGWDEVAITFTWDGTGTANFDVVDVSVTAGALIYIDGLILTAGATVVPYFDGDTPDTADIQYAWTGTPNASTSTKTLVSINPAYEVVAGVGLTSASVRKLADGTAIVADGSVTYHAVVAVEDADGPGPMSTDATGVPAQITSPDIAANQITSNELAANSVIAGKIATGAVTADKIGTGTLAATVVVTAGTAGGRRVAMDATGTPAFEAYDTTNTQTVNIDGVINYMRGTLATAETGARVEMGPGVLGSLPTNEVRLFTGSVNELDPASVYTLVLGGGSNAGALYLESPQFDASGTRATVALVNKGLGISSPNEVDISADRVAITATNGLDIAASVVNLTTGSMGSGSVGTGAFRTSVDARADARAAALNTWATSWTPTWTAATTNPALGNGTLVGRFSQVGKVVRFYIELTMGSTTTFGTGAWRFDLPVAEVTSRFACLGNAFDTSANDDWPLHLVRSASDQLSVKCDSTTAGGPVRGVTNAVPFAWATGDVFYVSGTYEAA